jgi:NADPH:quinone reductase-like Zn-dependent oxidoreductase
MGSLGTFKKVLRFLGEGKLKPVIDRVMPLDDCRTAHEVLEAGNQFGKIVLEVSK